MLPVGVQAAGGLAAAFDDVAREAAGREQVEVVRRHAEFVHEHAERDGGVDAAAGDDDLRTCIERSLHRPCAEIRVGGEHAFGQRGAALQFAQGVVVPGAVAAAAGDVVAAHHGDLQCNALLGGQGRECIGHSLAG